MNEIEIGSDAEREWARLSVGFNGSGKGYFKIWIVNLMLSIVTLGIYSA